MGFYVESRSQKMFSLLLLPSAAFAWAPAPGIPLERQIPLNRQIIGAGSGSGSGCNFEPVIQECNATQIYCDSGYYNGYNCWYGNYCIDQVNEWDGCHGVCSLNCDWATQDWCDMGVDTVGCWMGNWCQDKSLGGCPGSELNSGEDICAHMANTEECSDSQIWCDSGTSNEGCWMGNFCIDSVNSWDGCPGMCSTLCNWDTEIRCEMGIDANGCWMGNWCQDMSLGECPQVTMVSKRGAMEKMRSLAAKAKAIGN